MLFHGSHLSCLRIGVTWSYFFDPLTIRQAKFWTACFDFVVQKASPCFRMSLNYFGSRIKHSCLRIYGKLVCKEFFRSFYNFWRLNANRNVRLHDILDGSWTSSKRLLTGHGNLLKISFQESYLVRRANDLFRKSQNSPRGANNLFRERQNSLRERIKNSFGSHINPAMGQNNNRLWETKALLRRFDWPCQLNYLPL